VHECGHAILGVVTSAITDGDTVTKVRHTQGCWEAFVWYRPGLCQCRFRNGLKSLYFWA
jgi:hypothetical protein